MAAFPESQVCPQRCPAVIVRKRNHLGFSGEQELFQNKKRFSL